MQKFAHLVKTAEIRGVMAYLVDSEMVKVASEEDFDALVNEVAEAIGDEQYDLNTVLNKTAEVIEGSQEEQPEQEAEEEKTAEEQDLSQEDAEREIGKLTMAKMANEISDEEYEEKIASVRGRVAAKGRDYLDAVTGRNVGRAASEYRDARRFAQARPGEATRAGQRDAGRQLAREVGRTGAAAGGTGLAGYGAYRAARKK